MTQHIEEKSVNVVIYGTSLSTGIRPSKAVLLEILEKRKQKWEAMDVASRLKH